MPSAAHAFCGFYVSGAGGEMFNNATQVVLMREGTRTVLSMQNNYQGPPANFAMVVPVPTVLQKQNVKTLDASLFDRVDRLAAPRLVEYWEQDPCRPILPSKTSTRRTKRSKGKKATTKADSAKDLGVTIEAQFKVGEYEIVILSAKDSTGLDTWLRQERYQIPQGAEPLLRPYVEAGSKFFVAKVDVAKVKFQDGMAQLSPLRFHYDSETFSLPVRLGMINSSGTQDLIVHILARGKRYEAANYKNVTIPTNLDVKDTVRTRFGEFYASLFDAIVERNPGAVVTEYAWDASTCDPCPIPALGRNDLASLGLDVLFGAPASGDVNTPSATRARPGRKMRRRRSRGFVLTRLHARYGKGSLADDLVFREASAIAGGREVRGPDGLERGSRSSSRNNFQGRYAIRHAWTGPVECANPRRGVWGGPPPGVSGSSAPTPALDLAFAPRGKAKLASFVAGDIPELKVSSSASDPQPAGGSFAKPPPDQPPTSATGAGAGNPAPSAPEPGKQKTSKGCTAAGGVPGAGTLMLICGVLGVIAILGRRRRVGASERTPLD